MFHLFQSCTLAYHTVLKHVVVLSHCRRRQHVRLAENVRALSEPRATALSKDTPRDGPTGMERGSHKCTSYTSRPLTVLVVDRFCYPGTCSYAQKSSHRHSVSSQRMGCHAQVHASIRVTRHSGGWVRLCVYLSMLGEFQSNLRVVATMKREFGVKRTRITL